MRRLCAVITAGVLLVGGAWAGGTGTAQAAYQVDRIELCGPGDSNDCSINIRDEFGTLVEGVDAATIDVQGAAGVSGSLQMYAVDIEYGLHPDGSRATIVGFRAYGVAVPYMTNAAGEATVLVGVASLMAPDDSDSPIIFAFAGASLVALQHHSVPGVFGSSIGYPDETFIRTARGVLVDDPGTITDGVLMAGMSGGLTGDVYGVQMRIDGTWRDVTRLDAAGNGRVNSAGRADLSADLAGYPDGEYQMRLFNRTRGIYDLRPVKVVLAKDIYITPGEHLKSGRRWRTTCEPYSRTSRCRTEIWATTVENQGGRLVKRTGWAFNNLTYKASPRALWRGNPLGNAGSYTIDGRSWRTECDTPTTGRNGCRSYIVADVVQATRVGDSYTYKVVRKEVFNNIVLFEATD